MRNLRLLVAGAAIFALMLAISCGDDSSNPTETNCTDGIDNDGDGDTDCADSDCATHSSCTTCNFNSLCEPALGENATNCSDCATTPVCGNDICEIGENETNCPADCAADPCNNDGVCDAGETTANCPNDCPGGGQCVADADVLADNGCGAGETCDLGQTGVACRTTGAVAYYAACTVPTDCGVTASCLSTDGVTAFCMPFCDITGTPTCPGVGVCAATVQGHPTLGICIEGDACDPFAMTGCGAGEGCYFLAGGNTVCSTAGTVAIGGACLLVDDCSPGLICVGDPGACAELCDAAFTCTTGTCQGIGTIPNWPDIGYCQ